MDPVATTEIVFHTAGMTACAMAAAALAGDADLRRRGARVIAAPFALLAAAIALGLANAYGLYAGRPRLAGLAWVVVLALPATVYLATRRLVGGGRIGPADLPHLLPPALGAAALAFAFDAEGLRGPAADRLRTAAWIALVGLGAIYLTAAARLLRIGFRRWPELVAYRGGALERRLRLTLLLLALPVALILVEIVALRAVELGTGARIALGALRLACVLALASAMIRARPLFDGAGEDGPPEPEEGPGPGAGGRYDRSPLDPAQAARIAQKLDHAMARERLYREPFLGLRRLSDHLGVPPHRLSQVLNQRLGASFFDHVNAWRVREACERLLAEPDASILEIGEAVGFNSKSTFNAAFKKQVGMTPTDWRRRNRPGETPDRARPDPAGESAGRRAAR